MAGANLLRVNVTTNAGVSVGILSLFASADGAVKLAIKLDRSFVLYAGAKVRGAAAKRGSLQPPAPP
jgi:hypothetical protein